MASHSTKNTRRADLSGSWRTRPLHSAVAYSIRHRARTAVACVLVAVLAFAGAFAAALWLNLNKAVQDRSVVTTLPQENLDPNSGKPIKFVLIGQDSRDADNAALSGDGAENAGVHNADTTMVVEIGADRDFINLVSIPRDSLVDVPSCRTTKGTVPAQYGVMFNSIFSTAYAQGDDLSSAASCTVSAVNALTGLDIKNFIVVDFKGLADMIDAIGGVDVCIPVDTVDANTNMDLKKGMHHLDGPQATNYARMRYGTGTDGSDIMRTTRQQYLIKALLNEAISKNMLTQTSQLYQLALAAINSLSISSGMADTAALAGLAMSLRDMPLDHLYAQTVPVMQSAVDPNRVEWAPGAKEVWAKFREDKPLYGDDSETDEQTKDDQGAKGDDASEDPSPETSSPSSSHDEASDRQETQQPAEPQPAEQTNDQQVPSSESSPAVDPTTGLIKQADGTLIDPDTGGVVDPETGAILDTATNQYVGIAYQYLNSTVCAVPAHKD